MTLANLISVARIIFILLLFLTEPLSMAFYLIYAISGISDMADGYIARKTNTASRLGEKLDSAADLIMFIVLIIMLYPVINPPVRVLVWIIAIGLTRLLAVAVVFIKYKTFGMLHTYGNKITGFIVILLPFFLKIVPTDILLYIVCTIASISAVEELIIDIMTNEFQANRKSLLSGRI